jgi:hypothetical protein
MVKRQDLLDEKQMKTQIYWEMMEKRIILLTKKLG